METTTLPTDRTTLCYCCGTRYPVGHFQCCAAPNGMPSHRWLEQWCSVCAPAANARRCPRHCVCLKNVGFGAKPTQSDGPVRPDFSKFSDSKWVDAKQKQVNERDPGEDDA